VFLRRNAERTAWGSPRERFPVCLNEYTQIVEAIPNAAADVHPAGALIASSPFSEQLYAAIQNFCGFPFVQESVHVVPLFAT
jgi:hypothetical protein